MDERELKALFHEAPGDAPPPSFGLSDIEAGSRRATARHRMRVATAGAFAAVVLAGGGFAAAGLLSGDNGDGTAAQAGAAAESATAGQPEANDERLDNGESRSIEEYSSKQGDERSQDSNPGTTGTERCEEVDRTLATALAGELPVDPDTSEPVAGFLPCQSGVRRAGHHVADGDATGTISVAIVPQGLAMRVADRDDSALVETRAASGATVLVLSTPDGDSPPPLEYELKRIADALAAEH